MLTNAFKGNLNLTPQRHGQKLQFEPPTPEFEGLTTFQSSLNKVASAPEFLG
jgi:hypothetical protein